MKTFRASLFSTLIFACALVCGCGPEYVKVKPDDADIAGTYKLAKLKIDNDLASSIRERDITLTLKSDHKVVVADFPKFDMTGGRLVCRLSGSAEWQLSDQENGGAGWSLVFNNFVSSTAPTDSACNTTYPIPALLLLGEKAPHRLHMAVGDPSNDQGIEFEKAGS
jgi:hypothetical protein